MSAPADSPEETLSPPSLPPVIVPAPLASELPPPAVLPPTPSVHVVTALPPSTNSALSPRYFSPPLASPKPSSPPSVDLTPPPLPPPPAPVKASTPLPPLLVNAAPPPEKSSKPQIPPVTDITPPPQSLPELPLQPPVKTISPPLPPPHVKVSTPPSVSVTLPESPLPSVEASKPRPFANPPETTSSTLLPETPPLNPITDYPSPPQPLLPPPLTIVDSETPPLQPLQSPPLLLPLVPGNLTAQTERSHVSTTLIFGSVVGGALFLVLLALLCICYRATRSRKHSPAAKNYHNHKPQLKDQTTVQIVAPADGSHVITVLPEPTPHFPPRVGSGVCKSNKSGFSTNNIPTRLNPDTSSSGTFTYTELEVATNGFSMANLLGQGGFGYVYKGILINGKEVAVKRLKTGSHQGEREFQAEVDMISRVHHKHLVSLIGYCISGSQRLLVYEFISNNTMEFHIHGSSIDNRVLDWETRLKIAVGTAKGLAYLHEDCNPSIIHRDIKAANILLDSKFQAKVSDFGLAKFFSNTNAPVTHISTRVVGTFGYLAPEYASSGKLTGKSDVYSFGVLLLELITGRQPITTNEYLINESLVDWARPLLAKAHEDEKFDSLVDPRLHSGYNRREMGSMVTCAAACVRHSACLRPRMSQVVRALEGDVSLSNMDEGVTCRRNRTASSESMDYNEDRYRYDIERFKMMLSGDEHGGGINEYSKSNSSSSEYGRHISSSSSETQKSRHIG